MSVNINIASIANIANFASAASPGLNESVSALEKSFSTEIKLPALSAVLPAALVSLILSVLAFTASSGKRSGSSELAASAFSVSAAIIPGIAAAKAVSDFIETVSAMLSLSAPLSAFIAAAKGGAAKAALSGGTMLFLSSAFSAFIGGILLPLSSAVLAASALSGFFGESSVLPVFTFLRKLSEGALAIASAVFFGYIAVKCASSAAADSMALRGAKLAVSGFVPIVGGALSDALSAAIGELSLIGSSLGIFLLSALTAAFLPPLFSALSWWLSFSLSSAAADAFGEKKLAETYRSVGGAFRFMLSLLVSVFFAAAATFAVFLLSGGSK